MSLNYLVLAADSQRDMEYGASIESEFDTLKEAKARAKYYLTEEYRRNCEASHRLGYSQVKNSRGEIIADFFNNTGVKI